MKSFASVRGKNQSFNHPAHKRRFPKYAERANITFTDYVNNRSICDVNILSPAADLSFWSKIAETRKYNILFDGNDPYLLGEKDTVLEIFRGLFKYLTGSHKYLELNYKKTYINLCSNANVVISGHKSQVDYLKNHRIKTFKIPDYSIDSKILIKQNFELSHDGKIHIFWEGLGSSYKPFKLIEKIFITMPHRDRYIFHFVTDLEYFQYGDIFGKKNILKVAKYEAPIMFSQFKFYQWSEYMMNNIALACDICLIPLPYDDSLNYWKPENKLIHMWRMGIPTIVTPIPSYFDVILESSNVKSFAFDIEDWRSIVTEVISNKLIRKSMSECGYEYTKDHYSNEAIDLLWQNALNSL